MARRTSDDDLLMEDELTAAFLGEEEIVQHQSQPTQQEDEWDEEEAVPGQLAVDVYETKDKLVVKARTAGVNKNELDVSISDNTLSIRGSLNAGYEEDGGAYSDFDDKYKAFYRGLMADQLPSFNLANPLA